MAFICGAIKRDRSRSVGELQDVINEYESEVMAYQKNAELLEKEMARLDGDGRVAEEADLEDGVAVQGIQHLSE